MAKVRAYVDTELMKQVFKVFPETKGFNSATQLADWALRKLLANKGV